MVSHSESCAYELPPGGFEQPVFLIDSDAPESLAAQLHLDELWLKQRPATRILALRKFITDETAIKDDSVWQRLTSKEVIRYLEFDEATEAAIAADPEYRNLIERRNQKTSDEAAEDRALKVRLRRLEIFLERTKLARSLGRLSLSKEA